MAFIRVRGCFRAADGTLEQERESIINLDTVTKICRDEALDGYELTFINDERLCVKSLDATKIFKSIKAFL